MIEIKGVSKRFPDGKSWRDVFKGLDLKIDKGEFVALVGTSGCGKTTLLNMIGGLDYPEGGEILVNGVDVAKLSGAKRARFLNANVGFVFQFHYLLPEETALGNITLPMRIGGMSGRKARDRALELLKRLDMTEFWDAYPTTMSGGQCQRVAIARALANKPKLLLADEPTASLDQERKRDVFLDLLNLSRQDGTTVVLVTHDTGLIAPRPGEPAVDRVIDVSKYNPKTTAVAA